MAGILDEQVLVIMNALNNRVRLVGGCVRDYLLHRPVQDIDMATPLAPKEVMDLLNQAGIQVVPTGLKHGTVTAVIQHRPFEITTLRQDLKTDGRHAVVGWTADYVLDAKRRDFTFNALYMDHLGKIYDPVGGLKDLKKRRVCFIGEPADRFIDDPDPREYIVEESELAIEQPGPEKTDCESGESVSVEYESGVDATACEGLLQEKRQAEAEQELEHQREDGPYDRIAEYLPEADIRIADDRLEIVETDEMDIGQIEHVIVLERHHDAACQREIQESNNQQECWDHHQNVPLVLHLPSSFSWENQA